MNRNASESPSNPVTIAAWRAAVSDDTGTAFAELVQDDVILIFADLRQPTAAHLLVVPKRHVETKCPTCTSTSWCASRATTSSRVYPARPPHPDRATLDRLAATVRAGFSRPR